MWGYWRPPLMYAENAIPVNEMFAPRRNTNSSNTLYLGVTVLERRDIYPRGYWYWLGSAALLRFLLLCNLLFTLALAYLNPLGKPQAVISEETPEEMEGQQEDREQEPYTTWPSRSRRGSLPRSLSSADGNNTIEMHMRHMSSRSIRLEGNKNESTLEVVTGVAPKRGMILPFSPPGMSFEDVKCFVDMPMEMREQGVTAERLQLLRDVTAAFRLGVLIALMGQRC